MRRKDTAACSRAACTAVSKGQHLVGLRAQVGHIGRRRPPPADDRQVLLRRPTGEEPRFFSFTGTTDARFFNLYYGIPTTCYGPAGANLHAPDEWVDLESLREVTEVLALSVMEWCGVVG